MAEIMVTTRQGETYPVPAEPGQSIMEIIRQAGVDSIEALCGGNCSCGTCHIYLEDPDRVPAARLEEMDLLSASDHQKPNSRLGCQILFEEPMNGLRVVVAPEE